LVGITLFTLGDYAIIFYVIYSTITRFGMPADLFTLLASIGIIFECFGTIFVGLHLIFHDKIVLERLRNWFYSDELE
jgi:hypothetical protein